MPFDRTIERGGDAFHGQIIMGWTNATCGKNIIVRLGKYPDLGRNEVELIRDDRYLADVDTEIPQFTDEVQRVFVPGFAG